jgi:hypothetical protein
MLADDKAAFGEPGASLVGRDWTNVQAELIETIVVPLRPAAAYRPDRSRPARPRRRGRY